jgi:hypothetical protein
MNKTGGKISFDETVKIIYQKSEGHRSVVINGGFGAKSFVIPDQFKHILSCLPMKDNKWYVDMFAC